MKTILIQKSYVFFLLVSTFLWSQTIEYRSLGVPNSAVRAITNEGKALTNSFIYNYTTKEIQAKETFITNYVHMNEQGHIVALGKENDVTVPFYQLGEGKSWNKLPVLGAGGSESAGISFISPNGKYIVGQMKAKAYLYNTETHEIEDLSINFKYGAAYSVNSLGVAGGWVDNAISGNFREVAVMEKDAKVSILFSGITQAINNEIRFVGDDGIVLGNVNKRPFSYNIHNHEYVIYETPIGYKEAAFGAAANGMFVGYTQNSPVDREPIIYHPSLGTQPKLLREVLVNNGVSIPSAKLGVANIISENGDYIGGMDTGNGAVATGWIVKLNGFFEETSSCEINVPADISVQAAIGDIGVKVNYSVTSTCSEHTLVQTEGIASGDLFPIGVTKVSYDLVSSSNEIIASASFKVQVKDVYCAPAFLVEVEPITKVSFVSINNASSASSTSPQNEYFLTQSADVKQGGTYEMKIEGNTNGPDTDELVVFFDFDQNQEFSYEEGYYIGQLKNSTGTDGISVSKNITIPIDTPLGVTRMRVVKVYKTLPTGACGTTYAYGQSEDYLINVQEKSLLTNEVVKKMIQISPNPVVNNLTIKVDEAIEEVNIFTISGERVASGKQTVINLAHLPKGVYIISIRTTNGSYKQKFIKK